MGVGAVLTRYSWAAPYTEHMLWMQTPGAGLFFFFSCLGVMAQGGCGDTQKLLAEHWVFYEYHNNCLNDVKKKFIAFSQITEEHQIFLEDPTTM